MHTVNPSKQLSRKRIISTNIEGKPLDKSYSMIKLENIF